MGVYGALFAGVSGLTAQGQSMSMISDNIANVNTVGYKASVARFTTLVTSPPSPRAYNSGGVLSNTTQMIDQQGLLQSSQSATDLAISGRGFFPTASQVDPTTGIVPVGTERLFTRAGSFSPNKDGRLVNTAGRYLLGVSIAPGQFADPDNIDLNQLPLPDTSQLISVNVARLTSNASRSSVISLGANLATIIPPMTSPNPGTQIGSLTPAGASFQTSQTIYDSLGVAHTMTLVFTRDGGIGSRQFQVGIASMSYVDASGVTTSSGTVNGTAFSTNPSTQTIGDVTQGGSFYLGTVKFNTDGTISSYSFNAAGNTAAQVSINWTTGAWTTNFNLGFTNNKPNPVVTINSGFTATTLITIGTQNNPDGLTNYDSASATTSINQNGVPFGYRTGVSVDDHGIVRAIFDNGARVPVAVIPLVTFTDVNSLTPRTDNTYAESQASGNRTLNYAGRGGSGLVKGNALESSTVDLATEFSNMIVTQRAYQANTRTITTSDQMLQDVINIIR